MRHPLGFAFIAACVISSLTLSAMGNVVFQLEPQPVEYTINYFEHMAAKVHYFVNSTNVLYFDDVAGNVYISEDESKSWRPVDGIPGNSTALSQLIEHPFDSRVAFVLTKGTTHYKTQDTGRTWQAFEVPLPPASVEPESLLSFHADPQRSGYVLYQGLKCGFLNNSYCYEETFYTTDTFSTAPKLLLSQTRRCLFAHSSREFAPDDYSNLILCHVSAALNNPQSNLLASFDLFVENTLTVAFGPGWMVHREVVGIGVASKFLFVVAESEFSWDGFSIYITTDFKSWTRGDTSWDADAPYTAVGSSPDSLKIVFPGSQWHQLGQLRISNSNTARFSFSLDNVALLDSGLVKYMDLVDVGDIAMANYGEIHYPNITYRTVLTRDDGVSWNLIKAPSVDMDGNPFECNTEDLYNCSLELHIIPKRVPNSHSCPFGVVLAVGSVSGSLRPYNDGDTFLSNDVGTTWKHVRHGPHKYAIGNQGSVIVLVDDAQFVDYIIYSIDSGETWQRLNFSISLRALLLETSPSSQSLRFMLIGSLSRNNSSAEQRYAAIQLDFESLMSPRCQSSDMEKWYVRGRDGVGCRMGQRQWFWRQRRGTKCHVDEEFSNSWAHLEQCLCTDTDYGCDYNHTDRGGKCVLAEFESIPAGACLGDTLSQTYLTTSGYRLTPGNLCKKEGGVIKDEPIVKKCSEARLGHHYLRSTNHEFRSSVKSYHYFPESEAVLVHLWDQSVWRSYDGGRNLIGPLFPWDRFVAVHIHPYSTRRAYLLTAGQRYYYTTNGGLSWDIARPPLPATLYGLTQIGFHPTSPDYLIWTGDFGCSYWFPDNCHVESYLSFDHGQQWELIEKYVQKCTFSEASGFVRDHKGILCASYSQKTGDQRTFDSSNPLEFVVGRDWYTRKEKVFQNISSFEAHGEYLFVMAFDERTPSLDLQVSNRGEIFAKAHFPHGMESDRNEWKRHSPIVYSSLGAVFIQAGVSTRWRSLLKSNSDGLYYVLSLDYVRWDAEGHLDYYTTAINGIAFANVLQMTSQGDQTQTLITQNDGASWHPLRSPVKDSNGEAYSCSAPSCSLHLHGRSLANKRQRLQSEALVVGIMLAIGNVGESLGPYNAADVFLTRDAGVTWEEVYKGPHLWSFSDSGSFMILVRDQEPTDRVHYSTDNGLHWGEYNFGIRLKVYSLDPISSFLQMEPDYKFLLSGHNPDAGESAASVAIHLDIKIFGRQCEFSYYYDRSYNDKDIESWNLNRGSEDQCLLGVHSFRHRRRRLAACYARILYDPTTIVDHCECAREDFECEYNHVLQNDTNECVLIEGATPLPSDTSCSEDFWYERTAYRKISKSLCVNGLKLDRGAKHRCFPSADYHIPSPNRH